MMDIEYQNFYNELAKQCLEKRITPYYVETVVDLTQFKDDDFVDSIYLNLVSMEQQDLRPLGETLRQIQISKTFQFGGNIFIKCKEKYKGNILLSTFDFREQYRSEINKLKSADMLARIERLLARAARETGGAVKTNVNQLAKNLDIDLRGEYIAEKQLIIANSAKYVLDTYGKVDPITRKVDINVTSDLVDEIKLNVNAQIENMIKQKEEEMMRTVAQFCVMLQKPLCYSATAQPLSLDNVAISPSKLPTAQVVRFNEDFCFVNARGELEPVKIDLSNIVVVSAVTHADGYILEAKNVLFTNINFIKYYIEALHN